MQISPADQTQMFYDNLVKELQSSSLRPFYLMNQSHEIFMNQNQKDEVLKIYPNATIKCFSHSNKTYYSVHSEDWKLLHQTGDYTGWYYYCFDINNTLRFVYFCGSTENNLTIIDTQSDAYLKLFTVIKQACNKSLFSL